MFRSTVAQTIPGVQVPLKARPEAESARKTTTKEKLQELMDTMGEVSHHLMSEL